MSTIRTGLPQTSSSQGLDTSNARSAQAAFFRAALGVEQVPQGQAAQTLAPSAAVMSTIRTANPAQPAETSLTAPQREEPRILRPGSYLDILV